MALRAIFSAASSFCEGCVLATLATLDGVADLTEGCLTAIGQELGFVAVEVSVTQEARQGPLLPLEHQEAEEDSEDVENLQEAEYGSLSSFECHEAEEEGEEVEIAEVERVSTAGEGDVVGTEDVEGGRSEEAEVVETVCLSAGEERDVVDTETFEGEGEGDVIIDLESVSAGEEGEWEVTEGFEGQGEEIESSTEKSVRAGEEGKLVVPEGFELERADDDADIQTQAAAPALEEGEGATGSEGDEAERDEEATVAAETGPSAFEEDDEADQVDIAEQDYDEEFSSQAETLFSDDDAFDTATIFSDGASESSSPFSGGDLPALPSIPASSTGRQWGMELATGVYVAAGSVEGPLDNDFDEFVERPVFFPTVEEVRFIDQGCEGEVFHVSVLDASGEWQEMAAKVLLDGMCGDMLMGEISQARALDAVRHPSCVALRGYSTLNGKLALLLELAADSALHVPGRVLSRAKDLRWAAYSARRLAQALHATHAAGLIHRDVKPANMLLMPDGTPVLADFGTAIREVDFDELAQTLGFLPPEAWASKRQDKTGDVFAFGVSLWMLITGKSPTDGFDFPMQIIDHYASGKRFEWPEECRAVGQPLIDLAEAAYDQDAAARPPASLLVRRLELIESRLAQLAARDAKDGL